MTDLRKAAETDNIVEQAIQGHSSTRDSIRWAITQEREACAKVCDEQAKSPALSPLEKYRANFIAETIRARI